MSSWKADWELALRRFTSLGSLTVKAAAVRKGLNSRWTIDRSHPLVRRLHAYKCLIADIVGALEPNPYICLTGDRRNETVGATIISHLGLCSAMHVWVDEPLCTVDR